MAACEVRRLTGADRALLRDVRLAALLDAPGAFASTYAREVTFVEEDWQARLAPDRVTFVAEADGEPVGLATGLPSYVGVPGRRDLVSMWVHPAHRGRGIAASLVDAVVGWARADGADEVELWVVDGNVAAARAYERAGFAPTGLRQPLPSDPAVQESEWVRRLE